MGIKQLSVLLKKVAPSSLKERHIDEYRGRTLAIDASPCLYQCLTTSDTVGQEDDTSHVSGVVRRAVRLLELGIRPIFVFDGEAPEMKKSGALSQREHRRSRARENLEEARRNGDPEAVRRSLVQLVKVTQKHNDDAREILLAMGLPALQAPSEAECLCCAVVKAGLADAVATEDFDSLAFGAPKTIRFLHQAAAAPNVKAIQEVDLAAVLSSLSFTMSEFVDLCILCGCDYLGTIQRVGVQTAHKLMNEHRSIEAILGKLDRVKHPVPDSWDFASVRRWFQEPNVGDLGSLDLSFKPPQVQLLRDLLATKHGLPGTFVDEYVQRLAVVLGVATSAAESANIPEVPGGAPQLMASSRPVATPSRAAWSSRRNVPRSAEKERPPLPRGQITLRKCFDGAAKRPASGAVSSGVEGVSSDESHAGRKRQRTIARIAEVLGTAVDVPESASVEDLESLAAELMPQDAEVMPPVLERDDAQIAPTADAGGGQMPANVVWEID